MLKSIAAVSAFLLGALSFESLAGDDYYVNLRVDLMVDPAYSMLRDDRGICVMQMYQEILRAAEEHHWYVTEDIETKNFIFNKPETGFYFVCAQDEEIRVDIGVDDAPSKAIVPYDSIKVAKPH